MSGEPPQFDSPPEGHDGTESTPRQVSRLKLMIAILVMLIPAGVPLYFAFQTEGTAIIVLVGAAVAVAVMNTLLVYGIWTWINSMQSSS